MISVSLMEPILHPAPTHVTAKIHYGTQEWGITKWPCNMSFPLPPEHDLNLDFGKAWQETLCVLNLPLADLYKDGRLPLQIWVSLERLQSTFNSSGLEHLAEIMKRAEKIKSPKMHLLLTVSNMDAMLRQASQSTLIERTDLETAWLCEMQELQRGLEEANRKLENSIEIAREEEELFDEQLSQLCAQTEHQKHDSQASAKNRDEFELRTSTLQAMEAQIGFPTPMQGKVISRADELDIGKISDYDVAELTSELRTERENNVKATNVIAEWELRYDEEMQQVREELAETDEELRHYVGLAETLENENKNFADLLERRHDEWQTEIQSLERRLKSERKPEARRAPMTNGKSEDVTKVRALRKEVEKLTTEKEESENACALLRTELQSTRSRLATVEKEKEEAMLDRQRWKSDAENLEGEIVHLERTFANQLATLEESQTTTSQFFVAQADDAQWSSAHSSPKSMVLSNQPAHSFETKRARWPKPSELIREGPSIEIIKPSIN